MLSSDDIDVMRAHLVKWARPSAATSPADELRIAWHKARMAVTDIPRAERERSLAWLR